MSDAMWWRGRSEGSRRWRRGSIAFAGTVVALAALVSCASRAPSSAKVKISAVEPVQSNLVLWIDAPAPKFSLPSLVALPVRPTDARPCTAQDVSARFDGQNGAGGHLIHVVSFRNVGPLTCVLEGYPRVVATAPGRDAVIATDDGDRTQEGSANMAPGRSTELGVQTDTYCAAQPDGAQGLAPYHHLGIALPGAVPYPSTRTGVAST